MKTKLIVLSAVALGLFTSCSDDDTPAHIHEHEGIEELVIQRTNLDGTNPIDYEFEEGEALGEIITISQGEEYYFTITELNAHHSDGEHENILAEVLEEKDEHFFLYQTDTALNFERVDDTSSTSSNGVKLGVKVKVSADATQVGQLKIILKHQASAIDDLANGSLGSATGGATDVEATFPIVVN